MPGAILGSFDLYLTTEQYATCQHHPTPRREDKQRMVTRFLRGHTACKAMDTRSHELTWCLHLLSALRACGSARGHSVCGSAQFQTPELAASRRIWPQSLPPSLPVSDRLGERFYSRCLGDVCRTVTSVRTQIPLRDPGRTLFTPS